MTSYEEQLWMTSDRFRGDGELQAMVWLATDWQTPWSGAELEIDADAFDCECPGSCLQDHETD